MLVTMLVENSDQTSSWIVGDRRGDSVSWYEMVSNHANENGGGDLTNNNWGTGLNLMARKAEKGKASSLSEVTTWRGSQNIVDCQQVCYD